MLGITHGKNSWLNSIQYFVVILQVFAIPLTGELSSVLPSVAKSKHNITYYEN